MDDKYILSGISENGFPKESFGKIILDALENQNPEGAAIIDGVTNEIITNREIIDGTKKMAAAFRKLGLERNDVIGVISENCLKYFIPVISSFCVGAIANLINNSYKSAELINIFNITKPKILIVSESCIELVKSIKEQFDFIEAVISFGNGCEGVYSFEEILKMGDDDSKHFEPLAVDVDDQVCTILCSSGTTGLPKGVMLTHNNFRLTMNYTIGKHLLGMSKSESTIGLMPFYHTFGVVVSFGCLISGMKHVILAKFKPDLFLKNIQEHKITKLFIVPPLVLFLAKSPMLDAYDLTSLKYIFCAAAPLGQEIQELVEKRLNVKIRQGYGLTEAAGIVTVHRTNVTACKTGSSGTVVPNCRIKVVDIESGKPLGPNEVGEILVESEANMKGYMNNEEATRNSFDEFGFLKTGDIGYYDEEGYFFIVDRLKELIKYKGFQVPPAELENILVTHNCVKDAGVIGVPDEKCGELALAFIVKQPNCDVTEEEIIKYVAEYVSVPKQLHGGVRFIDELPKNPTGKLLRKKLKELV